MKRLLLLSTGVGLVPQIVAMVKAQARDIEIFNIVDDTIVKTIEENGNVVPEYIFARMADYCRYAEEMKADAVLLTCSSISEAMDVAAPLTSVKLFKIDEPMAEKAVSLCMKGIGIAATLETTLKPTTRLVRKKMAEQGKSLPVHASICEGAYEAYLKGDQEGQRFMVQKTVEELLERCDYVILAQASMMSAVESMDEALKERILTSPASGIRRVLEYLESRG